MNRPFVVAATVLIAIASFAGGAYIYTDQKAKEAAAVIVAESSLVRPHSPVLGREDAPVTIVEFLDPSCEACRAFYPLVKDILANYPEDVRVVVRYTPFHEGSDEAVRILEAARQQGKFEAVITALFLKQPEWAVHGQPNLKRAWEIAGETGLDLMKARLDSVKPEVDEVLRIDVADLKANRIQQTPTFFVNGKPLVNFSPDGLISLVEGEMAATK